MKFRELLVQRLVRRLILASLFSSLCCTAHPWFENAISPNSEIERDRKLGKHLSDQGKFSEAAQAYSKGARAAHLSGDLGAESEALLAVSYCEVKLFDYKRAELAAEHARDISIGRNDKELAGAVSVNIAAIYAQVGDYRQSSREAAQAADFLKNSVSNRDNLAKAQLLFANAEGERLQKQIEADRERGDASAESGALNEIERDYHRGIEVAKSAGADPLAATIWEELGASMLLAHHPERAEEPLLKAQQIETGERDENALAMNNERQAELQLQKQNFALALTFINRAFASKSDYFKSTPQYWPIYIKGVVLLGLHRETEALGELRRATNAATAWREGALPGDATSTYTVMSLHEVYQAFALLAADLAVRSHNEQLAREALETLTVNRAANLREEITRALNQKLALPPQYFDLLRSLQEAQARVSLGGGTEHDRAHLDQVRLEIGRIEDRFGLEPQNLPSFDEKNHAQNSLRRIQSKLNAREVLFSFCLGKEKSFGWAITSNGLNIYRLAGEKEIANAARQFTQQVQARQDFTNSGKVFSRQLFGDMSATDLNKPDWLIVGDGALLDGVPFSSLPAPLDESGKKLLAESHDLRFLPTSALLLSDCCVKPKPVFLGIGDPIYNLADPRWRKSANPSSATRASSALSRLVASEREVRTAARESGMPESQVLVGHDATVKRLQEAIARPPEILHFAVHVVEADQSSVGNPGQSSQAALALSLNTDAVPELLTPEAIATLRVPGTLVILSGCSSQKGDILPSAGLMGLTRAWLLAGASAVVVSAWPTPDDSGQFFSSFYSHLKAQSSGGVAERAALALQETQAEMQHGHGYRSSPKFWAAYSIISKE